MLDIKTTLTAEIVQKYHTTIEVTEDWVAYKNPDYCPTEPSLCENRFNKEGTVAFYVASGIEVAMKEIPRYDQYELYYMRKGSYNAFDLAKFSEDYGLKEEFIKSKEQGGYGICQEVAEIVTATDGTISGVIYKSAAMNKNGENGYCLAILPPVSVGLGKDFFYQKTGS